MNILQSEASDEVKCTGVLTYWLHMHWPSGEPVQGVGLLAVRIFVDFKTEVKKKEKLWRLSKWNIS